MVNSGGVLKENQLAQIKQRILFSSLSLLAKSENLGHFDTNFTNCFNIFVTSGNENKFIIDTRPSLG